MKHSFTSSDTDIVLEPVHQPAHVHSQVQEISAVAARRPSYQPLRWPIANRLLDLVDQITNGRAGMLQRLFSYLFIGGLGALVNLAVFQLLYEKVSLPLDRRIHNVLALTIAYEISLLVNFMLNDYFTFRHLAGHRRSWLARCLRFHLTAGVGFFLTLMFQYSFHFFLHMPSLFAQALAIILVLFYNFTVHHLFTYRHIKGQPLEQAIDEGLRELAMAGSTGPHPAL